MLLTTQEAMRMCLLSCDEIVTPESEATNHHYPSGKYGCWSRRNPWCKHRPSTGSLPKNSSRYRMQQDNHITTEFSLSTPGFKRFSDAQIHSPILSDVRTSGYFWDLKRFNIRVATSELSSIGTCLSTRYLIFELSTFVIDPSSGPNRKSFS